MNTVNLFIGGNNRLFRLALAATLTSWLVAQPAAAQLANHTLQGYVEAGLAQNVALRREGIAVATATQQVRQAAGLFQPLVQLGATYSLANGGRTIDLPVGDLVNPVYST